MKNKLCISLALSGGGGRGSFHLGFIQALKEHDVEIKAISGTSVGALVGGAIACGLEPKEVLEILKSKEFKNIFKFNWFRGGAFKVDFNAPVIDKLFSVGDISNTKIPFYPCVTDIESHEVIYADKGDGKSLVTASCSLVPLLEPFSYEGRLLADGGIVDMMPTTPLMKYEYPILGINVMPSEMPKKITIFSILKRVWYLILTTNLPRDISRCKWYIAPLEVRKISILTVKNVQAGFDLGYEHGLAWCRENINI